MFKKLLVSFVAIITIFIFNALNNKPMFYNYSSQFTYYVGKGGSLCEMVQVDGLEYLALNKIKGESCYFIDNDFDIDDFLNQYDAKLIKTESVEGQVSYYAYSPKIKYCQTLFGKKVNLHVSIKNQRITVGSPLIYGSF